MASQETKPAYSGPQPIGAAVSKVLAPVTAKRGFAAADLVATWPSIVGERYAEFTQPESLSWPRQAEGKGLLTIRVEGGRAIYLQHETGPLLERINRFLGAPMIGAVRLVQKPLARVKPKPTAKRAEPSPKDREAAERSLAGFEEGPLRDALRQLGEEVFAENSLKSEP